MIHGLTLGKKLVMHQTLCIKESDHSWLSQAATRSSGMWLQEMLPSILHGCHFDTISFSIKYYVLDIFDQTSYIEPY
jgi:hypothetical protein